MCLAAAAAHVVKRRQEEKDSRSADAGVDVVVPRSRREPSHHEDVPGRKEIGEIPGKFPENPAFQDHTPVSIRLARNRLRSTEPLYREKRRKWARNDTLKYTLNNARM